MRRHLLTLALAALFGTTLLAADASACCHKRRCAQPCQVVVAAPVVAPAPAPCPAPVTCCAKPRKRLFAGLCHKKRAACAPVVAYAPAAPVVVPSGQASPQASAQY